MPQFMSPLAGAPSVRGAEAALPHPSQLQVAGRLSVRPLPRFLLLWLLDVIIKSSFFSLQFHGWQR